MLARSTNILLALVVSAAPLAAQIVVRNPLPTPNPRTDPVIIGTGGNESGRTNDRIPPGQLPPRGMCRVWIDGVPPGHQPPVTDCATAERSRTANSRVIYGDQSSFPGKGRGKFKKQSRGGRTDGASQDCAYRDGVVVNGRVVDVCRDANGNVVRQRSARRGARDDDDNELDDDREGRAGRASRASRADAGRSQQMRTARSKRGKGHDK